ncbi:PTS glucose transporter subunit IIA [Shewanella sp. 202IG2-18]|uniref:PTS glucose transporter subunit IIA n=1 Tax=Parashewanella hymeniacidonis TaxID=2807618 RepID=UPI00196223EF|nr:PTS glucose transporter subunit IIA [Parashewanella hymeniacidonis]MBM7071345.1 PTS glucose transporter subunit IIA [Parashewanella hymeniacidonis]
MGLFQKISGLFKKQKTIDPGINIYAPVSGKIVDIEQVPDVVFAEKIVGDGIAIYPNGDTLYAPIDGVIGKIFETNHAFSIESDDGLELFVHFGIGTVELQGNGFKRIAEEGEKVKAGDAIVSFDLNFIQIQVDSILTPVVLANMEDVKSIKKFDGNVMAQSDVIFNVTL